MRAVRIHAYGGPEVMRVDDLPAPLPGKDQRLVKLEAASVNPIDWKMREGLMRMPLPRILGRDGAGTCAGRRIMGLAERGADGTHAQFALFRDESSAAIPEGVSFEEAGALGISGLSAWIPLVENARISAGQRVLIHAGAGGVGSIAIQIARLHGAEVWTTCSARNAEWCRALGAERTIDYASEDFAAHSFDVILDTLGGAVHRRSGDALRPGGTLVYLSAAPTEPVVRKDVRVLPTDVRPTRERLEALLNLVSGKKLRVPVEARFPLDRAAEAYELSRGGHARGKIVLTI